MSTTFPFHTTVPSDGTITLPPEFRGKPVSIAVDSEPLHQTGILSIAGILKDGPSENVHAQSPIQDLLDFCTKDASLCTDEELDDARYEYLMEKYG